MVDSSNPEIEKPEVPEPALRLSLQAEPGVPIEIDSVTYTVMTGEHLSMNKEDEVRALLQREALYTRRAERTDPDDEKAHIEVAKKLRMIRQGLLGLMTDIPSETILELTSFQQSQIVEVVGRGIQ